ncbi:hypothetical protein H8356DRAFT_1282054 [Neocallimastix lanati (nom. inval.)]|uniref:Uncharacterized protein n=1 Tax=Neocallimastix californiae TaxID=1754190 RepID=A0A1Y2AJZ1_9FUNG|nr:hypothetical protein H8356DRAFT_1282054 [Neocallimastix sp. JGI-2020a]ORY22879.1 hypothetical protein LY90DRAFT_515295 [Neocallimastix californiae]|eukprot:ORY22879.1 hypothetical protein LY90DRAFT_515295 [Neocallimastix californiae]
MESENQDSASRPPKKINIGAEFAKTISSELNSRLSSLNAVPPVPPKRDDSPPLPPRRGENVKISNENLEDFDFPDDDAPPPPIPPRGEKEDTISILKNEIKSLKSEKCLSDDKIKQLKYENDTLKSENDTLKSENKKLKKDIKNLQEKSEFL